MPPGIYKLTKSSVAWANGFPPSPRSRPAPSATLRRPACPVAAIYESIDATPAHQKILIEANAIYRNGDPDTIARAEALAKQHVAEHADIMAVPAAERQAAHARF